MSLSRKSRPARSLARAAGVLSLVPVAAMAQDQMVALASTQPMEAVVVSATRSPQPRSSVLADVSVIERDEIERAGVFSVADLLARQPGVQISRNGGVGNNTSVYIRGAENRQVAVYLDGVRVDSQTSGGAMWEQIPIEQIERIEVLRGPGAAVYGSDAIGGVVQLFTKRGAGPMRASASLSAGTYNTRQGQVSLSGGDGAVDYSLSASHGRSDGFSAKTDAGSNPDADGWQRGSLLARVGWAFAPGHRLDATLQGSHVRAGYDASKTLDDVARHELRTAALSWQGRWSETSESRVQLGETNSVYELQPSYYRAETTLRDFLAQHELRLGSQRVTVAVERREDKLDLVSPTTKVMPVLRDGRFQNGVMAGWRGDFGAHSLQVHARHDHDSEFGGKSTGSLAWGWRFAPQWRASASAATTFRVPTLYQRFGPYGVSTLVPESGHNVELGLRWAEGGSEAGATVWRNDVDNLINFGGAGPCPNKTSCYANVGSARLEGLTLDGRTRLAGMSLRGSLDLNNPTNQDTGRQLARRAKQVATLGADTAWGGWNLGAEVQTVGARFDKEDNLQRLGGFTLFNLVASRSLVPGLELQARVDNLADKAYETARFYGTAGRTLLVSLRWTQQ
ncbi:TonB-dependent receptor domain-containing protein [Azohydromonas australica]|uniref:TonB-dependent receptor domain-containing protein n=1 Tax=Azohydromonas australica TaxID=364039 RepID=UPI00040162FF|nr:TonB-dependent receptor [Azohydromonas australica]